MRFPGRFPARYILEKLGGVLREQYDAVVREDPPERLNQLLSRLRLRNLDAPKRGSGGPKHFKSR